MTDEATPKVAASGDTVEWATVKAGAISAFNGELPNDGAEVVVIEAFKTYPQQVIHEINVVAERLASGTIRSGWAILRLRVANIETIAKQQRSATVSLGPNRDKSHARAAQWMRAAGMYLPTEAEVIDELFGERGQLEPFPELQEDMLDLWRSLQVSARQTEEAATQRMLAYRAKRILAEGGKADHTGGIPPEARDATPFSNLSFPGVRESEEGQAAERVAPPSSPLASPSPPASAPAE